MKTTQKLRILKWFRTHKYLTRLQAFDKLGIFELSGRLNDLKRDGYIFDKSKRIKVTNRFGEEMSVVQYRLDGHSGLICS
jgi:uncharacterized protein YpbB